MPGRRAIDSAIEMSGSLPMSSAETASTMPCSRRLILIESGCSRRMPVTMIAARSIAASPAAVALGLARRVGAAGQPAAADRWAALRIVVGWRDSLREGTAKAARRAKCRPSRNARRALSAAN